MRPVLERVKRGEVNVVEIQKPDPGSYAVSCRPLPDGMDDGAVQIAEFHRRLQSGEVRLGDVYPRMDAAEMAKIPEIARKLTLKGF